MTTRASHVAECRKRIAQAKHVEMAMLGAESGPYVARISKRDARRIIGESGFDAEVIRYPDGVAVVQSGTSHPDITEDECRCCKEAGK